jgi:hypothetical protein
MPGMVANRACIDCRQRLMVGLGSSDHRSLERSGASASARTGPSRGSAPSLPGLRITGDKAESIAAIDDFGHDSVSSGSLSRLLGSALRAFAPTRGYGR